MPTPTESQIDTTQLVLELDSYSQTAELIAGLTSGQWEAQLEFNAAWKKLTSGKAGIKKVGSIEFFSGGETKTLTLKEITNFSRRRFGLPELTSVSCIPTTLNWMA